MLYFQVVLQDAAGGSGGGGLHLSLLLSVLFDYLCAVNILSSRYGVRVLCVSLCCCVFLCCMCVCGVWVLTLPGWLWLPMAVGRPSGVQALSWWG